MFENGVPPSLPRHRGLSASKDLESVHKINIKKENKNYQLKANRSYILVIAKKIEASLPLLHHAKPSMKSPSWGDYENFTQR